jgi:hypothetical protein
MNIKSLRIFDRLLLYEIGQILHGYGHEDGTTSPDWKSKDIVSFYLGWKTVVLSSATGVPTILLTTQPMITQLITPMAP